MIPVVSFAQRKAAVFGLGGSGIATARALIAGGAKVAAWDDEPAAVRKRERRAFPSKIWQRPIGARTRRSFLLLARR